MLHEIGMGRANHHPKAQTELLRRGQSAEHHINPKAPTEQFRRGQWAKQHHHPKVQTERLRGGKWAPVTSILNTSYTAS